MSTEVKSHFKSFM